MRTATPAARRGFGRQALSRVAPLPQGRRREAAGRGRSAPTRQRPSHRGGPDGRRSRGPRGTAFSGGTGTRSRRLGWLHRRACEFGAGSGSGGVRSARYYPSWARGSEAIPAPDASLFSASYDRSPFSDGGNAKICQKPEAGSLPVSKWSGSACVTIMRRIWRRRITDLPLRISSTK